MRVAVIGATGVVGETILRVLEERKVPVDALLAYASRERDNAVTFRGASLPVAVATSRALARSRAIARSRRSSARTSIPRRPLSATLSRPCSISTPSMPTLSPSTKRRLISAGCDIFVHAEKWRDSGCADCGCDVKTLEPDMQTKQMKIAVWRNR